VTNRRVGDTMGEGRGYSVDMLDRGMIHILDRTEWNILRFPDDTLNDTQLKIYEVFISGIFCLTVSDLSLLQVTEITDAGVGEWKQSHCNLKFSRSQILKRNEQNYFYNKYHSFILYSIFFHYFAFCFLYQVFKIRCICYTIAQLSSD
jgi:hypothetical protein